MVVGPYGAWSLCFGGYYRNNFTIIWNLGNKGLHLPHG